MGGKGVLRAVANVNDKVAPEIIDGAFNITGSSDPRVRGTFAYNPDHRLLSESYSTGMSDAFQYDADGNLLCMNDAEGRKTYTYDTLNRMVQAANGATGVVEKYTYDLLDRRTGMRVSIGSDSYNYGYTYYANGPLEQLTDEAGLVTSFTYDAMKRLTQVKLPAAGATENYFYDEANGRLRAEVNLDGKGEAYSRYAYAHDGAGNVLSETDLVGTIAYGYKHRYDLTSAAYLVKCLENVYPMGYNNPCLKQSLVAPNTSRFRQTFTRPNGTWTH